MDDIDNIKMALFGSEYTRGLVKRVEIIETKINDIDDTIISKIRTSEDKYFTTITSLEKGFDDKEKKHIEAFEKHINEYCGVLCKGSSIIKAHEEQHKIMSAYTEKEKDRFLEDKKSKRTILIAIIAAAVPGIITMIRELFRP